MTQGTRASTRFPNVAAWLLAAAWMAAIGLPSCDDEEASAPADAGAEAGDAAAEAEAPPLTPVEVADSFCAAFQTALCQRVGDCACGDDAVTACEDDADSCLAGLPVVRAALEADILRIDSAVAESLAGQLVASAACGSLDEILGFTVADRLTWGGLLQGTADPGEECAVLDDIGVLSTCRNGFCVGGICMAWAGAGETCGPDTACLHAEEPAALLEDGTAESSCEQDTGRCRGPQPVDGPCADAVDCQSGFCDGARCADKVADGGRCFEGSDCESGHCDIAESECQPQLASGVECIADGDCSSGFCRREDGAARGTCAAPAARGEACEDEQPAGCVSGACKGGVCVERLCLAW